MFSKEKDVPSEVKTAYSKIEMTLTHADSSKPEWPRVWPGKQMGH